MTWRATAPLPHLFLLLPPFSLQKIADPSPLFYHKSTSHHHKSSHTNTQSINISILTQLFLRLPTSSKQNYLFFV